MLTRLPPEEWPDLPALRQAAGQMRRLFRIAAPDAPGLVLLGGEVDAGQGRPPLPCAGAGLDLESAFAACVGEAVERASQVPDGAEAVAPGPLPAGAEVVAPGVEGPWLPARRLHDGAPGFVPAALCLRGVGPVTRPLSIGCAAGETMAAAELSGVLECIERDAAALWWRGGAPARAVAPEDAAPAWALAGRARQGRGRRHSRLLDITSDLGVPVVAAISVPVQGDGFVCGLGCRSTLAEAACAAMRELLQGEVGLHLVALKRADSGEVRLNAADHAHLARAGFAASSCGLLTPTLPPRNVPPAIDPVACLAARGYAAWSVDLTRPRLGLPVARIVVPGLSCEPGSDPTARLQGTIARHGGTSSVTQGVPLL